MRRTEDISRNKSYDIRKVNIRTKKQVEGEVETEASEREKVGRNSPVQY